MPEASFAVLRQAIDNREAPVTRQTVDQVMLAHLRRLSPADLARYCGGDGLENRLWTAIRDNTTFSAVCTAAQTRRYPLARVRRALMRAWLDLPLEIPPTVNYIRVLAVGARGREILRTMKDTCALPVIVKPVTERALPNEIQPLLASDALADDLYALSLIHI